MTLAYDSESNKDPTARDRVGVEMVRAAVVEFLGMERSLRAAAAHLEAARGIRESDDGAGEAAGVGPELAAMAARVTLVG